jgi:hypothetical protein
MGAILAFLLKLLGGSGGAIATIATQLRQAQADKLNAKSEQEKVAAQERVDTLTLLLKDQQDARAAARSLPWWMAVLGFMIGFPFALHVFLVGLGTCFQPLIIGGVFDWMLRIPKFPAPLDSSELGIIGFFFGSAAVLGGAQAIAGAIAKRKAP